MSALGSLRATARSTALGSTRSALARFSTSSPHFSALDDLSSSIEKLAASNQSSSASSSSSTQRPLSGAVHTPRPAAATPISRDRQTVSGRAFLNGHYYNPQTLSYRSITEKAPQPARPLLGPSNKEAKAGDLLHINNLKPGKPSLHDDSYKNGAILSAYISEMGKIMPRSATGLTRKSQRNIGKAVRRARAMGLLPVMSRGGSRAGGAGWK
ncbi:uncharacterized protein PFL1_06806 [Pseudozyma flocculosa PF-1]|uniref:Small ribosomal subunit protein bS18m n=2 Tax=Pseudozyma flocculosa TaxID=84751 RepID=A0A5C3F209_9BASI|nr:uncharacterized protein PFL1_06806 [Pseudozyma flocculosa PF-1]EPQ25626.1 hypothetical protein PFL1_06806 [Pseudozyma flocculosa PF-1]SPO38553.1 related to 30s ribosomal protein s18 [Pseudozyma flocculosa]